jgi:hypothetical protein
MYHGTPEERAEMRRTVMALPHQRPTPAKEPSKSKRGRPAKKSKKAQVAEEDTAKVDNDALLSFPIVVTTYDIIIRDRVHLSKYDWGYIVVDEGHRLKNLNCKLMKEIKQYKSAGRMILTGTPLHVRISWVWCQYRCLISPRIISPNYGRYSTLSFPTFSPTSIRSKTCKSLSFTYSPSWPKDFPLVSTSLNSSTLYLQANRRRSSRRYTGS